MIEAKELRIGNWLLYNGIYCRVTKIDSWVGVNFNDGNKGAIPCTALEPIPLMPEILEKAGFVKKPYNRGQSEHTYKLLMPDRTPDAYPCLEIIAGEAWLNIHGYCFASPSCQFLHQLQNLYFALTGTELEINL